MVLRFHRAPAFSGSARFPSGDISHRLSGDTLHLMCPRGRLFVPPLRKVAPSRLLGLLPGSALAPRSDTRLSSPGVTQNLQQVHSMARGYLTDSKAPDHRSAVAWNSGLVTLPTVAERGTQPHPH